jgi:hypothetical protein
MLVTLALAADAAAAAHRRLAARQRWTGDRCSVATSPALLLAAAYAGHRPLHVSSLTDNQIVALLHHCHWSVGCSTWPARTAHRRLRRRRMLAGSAARRRHRQPLREHPARRASTCATWSIIGTPDRTVFLLLNALHPRPQALEPRRERTAGLPPQRHSLFSGAAGSQPAPGQRLARRRWHSAAPADLTAAARATAYRRHDQRPARHPARATAGPRLHQRAEPSAAQPAASRQVEDLLREYAIAGGSRVTAEVVDPISRTRNWRPKPTRPTASSPRPSRWPTATNRR